ncbi:V0/A0 complex, 116-kDa subunit of ATPase [Suhomyces tanzawaensis NRRL Y-17324]|uniref:V-type proton ATPase subunit a n=1 Tax=Suhomyces tanzawaensis NRRL Y-17324 TaxID=984487 RepID=A0A1E4SHA4_9ASCO|nr:V0/A0 complex, 116-kDa subunit of ATPase [Suhomyces tanzawaensis NRRL Y-17324]ODV78888.1 V0/A0 complex, 116-kDa subunit of ATPase [Suhomyces tanzawaensis NRRL Y-17324]
MLTLPPPDEAIFRSAPMTLVQFYLTIELARDVVNALGCLGNVHFRDLNSKLTPFQRTFITELRSVDAAEAKLTYLYDVMVKHNITNIASVTPGLPLASASEMDDIKQKVEYFHERIQHLEESYTSLDSQKSSLLENRYVVTALNEFHGSELVNPSDVFEIGSDDDDDDDGVALLNNNNHSLELGRDPGTAEALEAGFNAILGAIETDKIAVLRKILWRTLRGNLYFHDIPIREKLTKEGTSEPVAKSVFVIYIHGDFLRARVRKIIQSLDGKIYDNVNGGQLLRSATLSDLNQQIGNLDTIVETTLNHLITELRIFQEVYPEYAFAIQREKLIYLTLNKFDEDSTRRCLVGEGWIPKSEFENVRQTLKQLIRDRTHQATPSSQESIELSNESQNRPPSPDNFDITSLDSEDFGSLIAVVNELSTTRTPPTYHKTNKFTAAFQSIIDAYGIATYQEVNPGLATIITFPFMFAIMFGDLGHGLIVFLISLYLIKNEINFAAIRNKDEIFEMAFNGRYIILLMGFFSMYTGLIYNDIFSKSMTLFKSGWEWEFPKDYDPKNPVAMVAKKIVGKTYIFGLDWAWHGAENNLLFTNSYKMKLSILLGYVHMNYSLFFSLVNYRFFKSRVDIIGNFIPGFLFMQSIFGYLSLTILYKWTQDWLGTGRQPPGLLNMLINMFLSPGSVDEPLYAGQKFIQVVLVLIALACVPWLLIYKPLTLKWQNDRAVKLGYSDLHSLHEHSLQIHEEEQAIALENELNYDPPQDLGELNEDYRFPNDIEPLHHNSASHGDGPDFNLGDIVIHQVIHTIEFCLNCVSHTASYLRLWALSLAHSQLSTVLWSMTIQNAFGATGKFGIFMTVMLFGLWFILTICILVLMEGTSAMLHSLRLHWVEAMSKFFVGEGYAYEPFSFNEIDI